MRKKIERLEQKDFLFNIARGREKTRREGQHRSQYTRKFLKNSTAIENTQLLPEKYFFQ